MNNDNNSADGRTSFDTSVDGVLVSFFNRNVTPYPTEAGGPKFDLVPVERQKDIMINVARLHAKQEYNRIMELVSVLEKQAAKIKRRLDITDQVHASEYQFQVYHDQCYWLAFDTRKSKVILCHHGPGDALVTNDIEYIARVKWLGDYTWIEVNENGNPVE